MMLFSEEIEQLKIEPARQKPKNLYFSGLLKAKNIKTRATFCFKGHEKF